MGEGQRAAGKDPHPVLPPKWGRRMEPVYETRNKETTRRTAAQGCLSGRLAGESQRAAGVTVRERGGVAPVLWADVDAVRAG